MSVDGETLDDTRPCPGCGIEIGDHTIRGYKECLQKAGFDYVLPHEDIPGGPINFPGVEGPIVGEVTVMSAFIQTPMGRMPLLRFVFTGAGPDPMERRSLPPINLILDANGMKTFRQLVNQSVDRSILAARRGR